mmetsp:Transcript_29659/g.70485  ORF Transcript_29659/g.70485 Transcript_29659/m.70485 type:complete len:97 (+) Transcript_29659:126-416(+)
MARHDYGDGDEPSFDYTRKDEPYPDDEAEYYYDHARGRHVLMRKRDHSARQSPTYSFKCFLCNLVDVILFAGCVAFLYFSIRYAFYLLNNYGDGGG